MSRSLADKIKRARLEASLSQRELGVALGLSDKSISAYETGRAEPPFGVLKKMAKKTARPVAYFGEDDPKDYTVEAKLAQIEALFKEVRALLKKQPRS